MNPFAPFVAQFEALYLQGKNLPLGEGLAAPVPGDAPPARAPGPDAPKGLIFSPHPDDEVIIGGLPLRLLREAQVNILNVAVTQGSNKSRQAARLDELKACCDRIGFGLIQTAEHGLEGVNLKSRAAQPGAWARSVDRISAILDDYHPRVIFFPHDDDWNSTHIGTHHLVMDALAKLGPKFECLAVETEFWGAMDHPNLMVESSATDVADLIAALSFHVGEIRRNPYHLRLPGWLMDNVRRGGELVGGQGGAAPDFPFATLYRLRRWHDSRLENLYDGGKFLSKSDPPTTILSLAP